ncbi:MAG: adenylate/guanylate cyclase domain-containing protein [Nitrospiraceae bacterium]
MEAASSKFGMASMISMPAGENRLRSSQALISESYEAWRNQFGADRLRVLYYLGLIANPVFLAADILLYREHLHSLLVIRAILELGLLLGFVGLKQQIICIKPHILLAFWILFPNILVVHMTVVLGGAIRNEQALRVIPVIFLTARAGTEARVESLDAGADDYIAKPFDENELLARVGNLIRARAQERELVELQKEKIARFLPPHLADMIISGDRDDFLKGHRAEISVLFIDLRGFTSFAENADPEDLISVLRQYQTGMGRLISQYNGTLERFSGDAMMVFFNDPIPVPNHAEQAVRMAIAMREQVAGMCVEWSGRSIDLGVGIGVAAGYATLGIIGFEGRKDYAAIGPVTNLAARLCSEAQHGQILISGRFLQLVESLVNTEPVGSLALKGFHHPVSAHNIVGLRK